MTVLLSAETRLALAKLGYRDVAGALKGDAEILESFTGSTVSDRRQLLRAMADPVVRYVVLDAPRLNLIAQAVRLGPLVKPWFVDRVGRKDLDRVLAAGATRLILWQPDAAFLDQADCRLRARWRPNSDTDRIPEAFTLPINQTGFIGEQD